MHPIISAVPSSIIRQPHASFPAPGPTLPSSPPTNQGPVLDDPPSRAGAVHDPVQQREPGCHGGSLWDGDKVRAGSSTQHDEGSDATAYNAASAAAADIDAGSGDGGGDDEHKHANGPPAPS